LKLDVTVFHNMKFLVKYIVTRRLLKNAYAPRTVLRAIRERQGERKDKMKIFAERK